MTPSDFLVGITCIPVAAIANGDVNCTNGEFAGSVCIVACSYGYELRGKNPVRCSSDGLWSRRLPDCTSEFVNSTVTRISFTDFSCASRDVHWCSYFDKRSIFLRERPEIRLQPGV